jgi:hypothetical protein
MVNNEVSMLLELPPHQEQSLSTEGSLLEIPQVWFTHQLTVRPMQSGNSTVLSSSLGANSVLHNWS